MKPVYPGLYVNIDSTQKLISHNAKKNIKGRSTKKTKQYFQRRNQSLKALGEGSKRNDIWSRITLHAVVFADSKWVTPLYVYKAKGKDKIETLQLYRIRCDNSSSEYILNSVRGGGRVLCSSHRFAFRAQFAHCWLVFVGQFSP